MINCNKCNTEIIPQLEKDKTNPKTVYGFEKGFGHYGVIKVAFMKCINCEERYLISMSNETIRKNLKKIDNLKSIIKKAGKKVAKGRMKEHDYKVIFEKNKKLINQYTQENIKELNMLKTKYANLMHEYVI